MSTIRETALACYGGRLPRGTGAKAQEVLDCLIAREQEMFANIVEAGVGLGGSRDQIHDILVEAGLTAPTTVAASAGGDLGVIAKALDDLNAKVDRAIGWARGKGYRG